MTKQKSPHTQTQQNQQPEQSDRETDQDRSNANDDQFMRTWREHKLVQIALHARSVGRPITQY